MKRILIAFALAAAACMPAVAHAQAKPVANDQSITVLQGVGFGSLNGPATPVDMAHPLPVHILPYGSAKTLVVGVSASPGRGWKAVCSTGGNATLVLGGGSTDVVPLNVGLTVLPYAVTQVAAEGTTAVCTYTNLN